MPQFDESLPLRIVLQRYSGGPQSGVFTDGGARPNPGPGGWGLVWVENGEIKCQKHGHSPDTTNNRMELTALIEAFSLLPNEAAVDVFTDSELCVNTINLWAKSWEAHGWKRKSGPIKNLELVQKLYRLAGEHPKVKLRWIKAHDGSLWNEYADSLSSAWTREEL
ncbi:MAG: ribonuclease HI [Oligoflexia bacterium]|nr:ribonuclease HI [Oligoflexia bacterium]